MIQLRTTWLRVATAVGIAAAAAAAVGCGSSGASLSTDSTAASGGATTAAATTSTTVDVRASTATYTPNIDPSQFTTKIDNKYFPLAVGDHHVYTGTRDGAPIEARYTVLPQSKTVMGVKCVVVRDVVTSNHSLVEKTTDWYSQDSAGNVWYFGENTAEYENGVVVSTDGTWEAGVDNAQPGITTEANPKVGDAYRQEFRPGVAEDRAKVLSNDQSVTTPSGTYKNLIETLDINPLDPSKIEHKWYAAGVGFVHAVLHGGGHTEEIKLAK